jgi:hypothetical protein
VNRSLWILALLGVAGMLAVTFATRNLVTKVAGLEEAEELRGLLAGAYGSLFAPEPPLRVRRVQVAGDGARFRWRVEATLRPGRDPEKGEFARNLDRAAARVLGKRVMDQPPAGVTFVVRGDSGERTIRYAADGRRVEALAPGPSPTPPPAPPPGGAR